MRVITIILVGVLSTTRAAQGTSIRFEVASVKPSKPDPQKPPIVLPPVGGRFLATNTPLRLLIRIAYGIEEFQISGGPSWIDSSTFEITAKLPDGTPDTLSSMTPMLRTLLAERFKLQTHTERREQAIYVLTFVRDDKQLGPNLKPSTTDCSNAAEEMRKRVAAVASGRIGPIPNPGTRCRAQRWATLPAAVSVFAPTVNPSQRCFSSLCRSPSGLLWTKQGSPACTTGC